MTNTTWHAGPELLRRYADGSLDQVAQAAIEAHVDRCPQCRRDAAAAVSASGLAPVWGGVLREIRTPELPRPLRLLRALGVSDTDLVVVRWSGSLVLAFALAVGAVVFFLLAEGQLPGVWQQGLFLLLAPLLPSILVAGAYDSADALREVTDVTSFSKLRVALLRTVMAVTGAVPLALLMALVPQIDVAPTAWVFPSLALSLVLLALLCWYPAMFSLALVAGTWIGAVALMQLTGTLGWTDTAVAKVVALLVTAAALLVLSRRLGVLTVGSRLP